MQHDVKFMFDMVRDVRVIIFVYHRREKSASPKA